MKQELDTAHVPQSGSYYYPSEVLEMDLQELSKEAEPRAGASS